PCRLRAEEAALQVGVDDRVPLVFLEIEERLPDLDTRVVDEEIEAPELAEGPVDEHLHVGLPAHVAADIDRLRARLAKRVDERVCRVVVDVVDDEAIARLGQREGNALPDAACPTGDDRHAARLLPCSLLSHVPALPARYCAPTQLRLARRCSMCDLAEV